MLHQSNNNMQLTDREFLIWIHQRLIHVHKEFAYVDYMHRLRNIIYDTPARHDSGHNLIPPSDLLEMGRLSEYEKRELAEYKL